MRGILIAIYGKIINEMADKDIKGILKEYRTVAVVGLSPKEDRPSYNVAKYLKSKGYRIIPVNPNAREVLREVSYPDLKSIPAKVDIVDIFRRSEDVPPIVDEAIGSSGCRRRS